ncbi:class I SAM-dependent methyltransferase [Thiovibrio frasassiensis]|jgi:SAM-dependent methyltransferase|uniref:Class I SAM-dependent methyltransferase n=1 Tax=Thiovibrio frasassiensis TaxID=2984131 RepID=A0A9X4RMY8_9BACT|nr:class I SAM-dependent methyltransferase [Thiovibrio frasassiensis]MDG4476693.1 class I SAM-dependent methyltransferase [Thiovibrio frasassiensis]
MDNEENDIFFNIINRFVGFYSRDAVKETRNDPDCEYPFVAMDTRQIFAQFSFVSTFLGLDHAGQTARQPRILDVGCGIGNVLLVAEQFGFEVYGIEKDAYPFRIAARLIGEERIAQADIWSYEGYGNYEVVYYYRPFSGRDQQLRFEKLIEESMQTGAILIANHKNSDAIDRDHRFKKLSPSLPIWQKIRET